MISTQLKSGDALLLGGNGIIATPIEISEGGRYDHAAMVVLDQAGQWVYEMTWPRLIRTGLSPWLRQHGPVFACALEPALNAEQEMDLANWWFKRLGKWYDVPELLAMAGWLPWRRFVRWLGLGDWLAPPPIGLDGVCSVNCAWAWQAIGLAVANPTAVTPADVPSLPFLGPVQVVEI